MAIANIVKLLADNGKTVVRYGHGATARANRNTAGKRSDNNK